MNRIAGEGSGIRRYSRGLGLLGGIAAIAAVGVLAVGPAGADTTTTSSTSTSSTTSTTETPSTTTPTAVTQTAKPAFNCLGADPATTTLLNSIGPTFGYPKNSDGNYYIVSTWTVTSSVPQFLENGQTFPVSFSAQLDVSASLANVPSGDTLTVSGSPQFLISGGGSGGPFPGTSTGYSITVGTGPQTLPPVTASGTVTGVDKTKPIIYSMGTPLTSTITITSGATTLATLNLSCTAADPDVAATNGTLPPEPTTTTVAAAKPAATAANFTG